MPLQATSGAASYDGFGGGVAAVPQYIEDVFSTYLYTGNDSNRSITNGIDLSTEGGMTWIKVRNYGFFDHALFDTARGAGNYLKSNATSANTNQTTSLTSFNTNGFSLGTDPFGNVNASPYNYASWTFRKQPKFFDVVTYTGDGTSNRAISHNLGAVPGCIILKRYDGAVSWQVYHRATPGTPQNNTLQLNTTDAVATSAGYWGTTAFTDTQFRVSSYGGFNASGGTYVAYIFAHDAGGFGLTGTDNVISCGSYTGNGSTTGPVIDLGYEPQWLLIKRATGADLRSWVIYDNMRGMPVGGIDSELYPNTSSAESNPADRLSPTATGFQLTTDNTTVNASGATFIYIAIRRGPMKVPTSGTSVYNAYKPHSTGATISVGFPTDFLFTKQYDGVSGWGVGDRLRGNNAYLIFTNTNAEGSFANTWGFTQAQNTTYVNYNGANSISYFFRRAPSFFDEVCYTGTGSVTTVTHNLGAVPELMIVKSRSASPTNWIVYSQSTGAMNALFLNNTSGSVSGAIIWNNTAPTSSVFSLSTYTPNNASGGAFVAYLFATCAGVSKVGSYTGTGTTKQVDCGFTGGARFVLIKRTDSTGDWYVWDTARGIVAGNDPYLLLNTADAEVTTTDYIDTYSAGFEISSTAPAAINASGGTFIFLAIA